MSVRTIHEQVASSTLPSSGLTRWLAHLESLLSGKQNPSPAPLSPPPPQARFPGPDTWERREEVDSGDTNYLAESSTKHLESPV